MLALVYYRSVPRYLLGKVLNRMWPRRFWAGVVPLKLIQVPFRPPSPEWVVLRPRLCGLCGSDLQLLKGKESFLLEPYGSFPMVLGHEVVAEVVEAPKGSRWRSGDRVVVEPILACRARGLRLCSWCAQGRYNLCEHFTQGNLAPGPILGFHREAGGGLAELMAAPAENLVRVPDHVPDEIAVLSDSLASALQPVLDHLPPPEATVVIYGAGIIGQHLLRCLRAVGSRARVIVVARYEFQQKLAMTGGADVVLVNPVRLELAEALGGRFLPTTLGGGNVEGGADLWFDCVGSRTSLQEGLLGLRQRGTLVLVGTAGTIGRIDISSLWFRELHLTGSALYSTASFQGRQVRTYEMAIQFLAKKDYPLEGLLTHVFSLKDYARAFQTAFDKRRYQSVKVALSP